MRKKTPAIMLIMAIFISMCTGCTKYYYEEEEADAMCELGRSIVSDYIDENNLDATIVSCEATIYGTPVRYLTSYANGVIEEDGVTYEFYVDTETQQIYTGKYSDEISSVIENEFYDVMGLTDEDFINIESAKYELILPNKWGNENVPSGDVILNVCVAPIEITDIEEYILGDDSLMMSVMFEATATDDVDLSLLKDTNYLDVFAEKNMVPSSVSISNRLFNGYICRSHMFYSEFELVEFEEFEMGVMTHHFSKDKDGIDDYTYELDDVTIDQDGGDYYFSLLERYDDSFNTTRLAFYYEGDNPPDLSCTYTRKREEITEDCIWQEYDDGIWTLYSSRQRIFTREEFVLSR